jgi:hypothetical protein
MRLKEDEREQGIEISKDYVRESYEKGHYVEAIVIIHYALEVFMNSTYTTFLMANTLVNPSGLLERMKTKGKGRGKPSIYPISTYGFLTAANILLDIGVYTAELFAKLQKFNKYRNIVVHRLFKKLPNRKELDSYFKLGMELWETTWEVHQKYSKKFFDSLEQSLSALRAASK